MSARHAHGPKNPPHPGPRASDLTAQPRMYNYAVWCITMQCGSVVRLTEAFSSDRSDSPPTLTVGETEYQ